VVSPARRFPPPWTVATHTPVIARLNVRHHRPHKQVAICCLNITLNGGKLLLRNRATTICNTASGQMEAIMRAYIVIGTLAVLAVSAGIYTAQRLLGL